MHSVAGFISWLLSCECPDEEVVGVDYPLDIAYAAALLLMFILQLSSMLMVLFRAANAAG